MIRLDRRAFLQQAPAAGGCVLCGGHAFAGSGTVGRATGRYTSNRSSGCYVSPTDVARRAFRNTGTTFVRASSFKVGSESYKISSSSGDPYFDRALVQALYHMSELFGVTPTFGFIDGGNVANAMATTAIYDPEPGDAPLPARDDGTVLMGDGILALLATKGITNPVAAALAICAHEFGHIVQYRYTYDSTLIIDVLLNNQPTVKRAELHADFLAGYYIGTAKRRNPQTPAASVAQAVYSIGDFNVNDEGHHGTPDERGAAVYEGFKASYENSKEFTTALVEGMDYVGAL